MIVQVDPQPKKMQSCWHHLLFRSFSLTSVATVSFGEIGIFGTFWLLCFDGKDRTKKKGEDGFSGPDQGILKPENILQCSIETSRSWSIVEFQDISRDPNSAYNMEPWKPNCFKKKWHRISMDSNSTQKEFFWGRDPVKPLIRKKMWA